MTDTLFVPQVTPIPASWLNDVNSAVYKAIGTGTAVPGTPADVLTNLGLSPATGSNLIGYTQGGTGASTITVQSKLRDWVSVTDFGAKLDGTTDDTTAWTNAIATGKHIWFPSGTSYIKQKLTLNNGQVIQGAGRTQSYFKIDSLFNMAASSVIQLGTAEPGAELHDLGFQFAQANQGVRANITAYPPAIDGSGVARFILNNIRIEGAYDGIKATGNVGGAYIGFIEVGALRYGIQFDGALDFVHGGHWHFWPFGISGLTNLYNGVYLDGITQAAAIGRVDGFTVDSISTFSSFIAFTANANNTGITYQISKLCLDGDGARLTSAGGRISIGQCYCTKTTAPAVSSFTCSSNWLEINDLHVSTGEQAACIVPSSSGTIKVNSGYITLISAGASVASCAAGQLYLNNVTINPTNGIAYTNPHIAQSGTGGVVVTNCTWPGLGTSTGTAVSIGTDLGVNQVTENNMTTWTYTLPSNPVNGQYGPNQTPIRAWTPVLNFLTGNTGITYTTQIGKYVINGRTVTASFEIVLSNKGSSTGGATITGLPFVANFTGGNAASYVSNMTGLAHGVWLSVNFTSSTITLYDMGTTGVVALADTQFTNTSTLIGTITYQI